MKIGNCSQGVTFVLRNGDEIHVSLDQNASGPTRLCLWSDSGSLAVIPIDGRACRVTTQAQLGEFTEGGAK